MGDKAIDAIAAIVAAVIGLAIIAVLVSTKAQTGTVIGNAGTALSNIISAAVSPITGGGSLGGSGG